MTLAAIAVSILIVACAVLVGSVLQMAGDAS